MCSIKPDSSNLQARQQHLLVNCLLCHLKLDLVPGDPQHLAREHQHRPRQALVLLA